MYKGKDIEFEPWLVIYNYLETQCIGTNAAPPPHLVDPAALALALPQPIGPLIPPSLRTDQVQVPTEQQEVPTDQAQAPTVLAQVTEQVQDTTA